MFLLLLVNHNREFLEPGAPCEINIDGKTMEVVQHGLKNPSRYTFDAAAEHIYTLLLKKDCYPRFIRSEHYKNLLENGIQQNSKKRFFGFGGAAKKKSTSSAPPPTGLHPQVLLFNILSFYLPEFENFSNLDNVQFDKEKRIDQFRYRNLFCYFLRQEIFLILFFYFKGIGWYEFHTNSNNIASATWQ